jgi:uncharacterized damage-inducible protein DinB
MKFGVGVASPVDLRKTILDAWKTNNRVTIYLVRHLPEGLWNAKVPEAPRRTVGTIAAHIHNSRCMWLKTLGKPHGIAVPRNVNLRTVKPKEVAAALERSGAAMLALLQFGCDHGGNIPPTKAYAWRNLPLDVGHVLAYFVAHEGHHRGQIVMLARQLGYRLPAEVTAGIWQWTRRSKEN